MGRGPQLLCPSIAAQWTPRMRLLFVHERFGNFAGAEVNAWLTAAELKQRGHAIGLVHGSPTGKSEAAWRDVFGDRFPLDAVRDAVSAFDPDAIYLHKLADLDVLAALLDTGRPIVRMVHDHDLYCMRSYKYSPLTRRICTRGAGLHCLLPCGAMLSRNRNG